MIYVAAVAFAAVAVLMYVRRAEIARGQSMLWGGTTLPGCVVAQAVVLLLLAAAFVVADRLGWLG